MKLKVKTLKGVTFEVESEPDDTVASLKANVEAAMPEFPAALQKLIHSGKILEDSSCVKEYNIKEGEFIVVMVSKVQAKAPSPAAEAAPAAPPAPAAPAVADAASAQAGAVAEGTIAQLCDMGFPRPEVERCLQAAFGNPDRAVEYLMNGIPAGAGDAPPAGAPAAPPAAGGGGDGPAQTPAAGGGMAFPAIPAGARRGAAGGGSAALEQLRNHPRFEELAAMVAQNPAMLGQILQALGQTHPEFVQAISENEEEFFGMLQDSFGEGDEDEGMEEGMQIELTEAERASIERLAGLGFPPEAALEAYLACGKNEELAANYLFEATEMDG